VGRSKKSPKTDKHGFPVLDRDDDLFVLFGEDEDETRESFAGVFEQTFSPDHLSKSLQEKEGISASDRVLTVRERIRRYPGPEAEVDLHGCTARQAARRVESFVVASRTRGLHTVRIITGKGLHSPGEAVLPPVVEERLRELKREKMVLACRWEGKSRRSSGSVIVYLEH
jgi:DNA-nicking Smr family endonuclease